ncbi:MAG TPA: rhodanese-related sulfurtransferase [Patescibacteria group bacterium]|nr:rhodanese-related sulfurtransferase [Patescibacteria group bacterium]
MAYEVLLFYKYVAIDDPEKVCEAQKTLCKTLHLKGRIIVAHNGINGTVEGVKKDTTAYVKQMQQDPRFANIVFKKSEGTGEALRKLQVRVRRDLVSDQTDEWGVDPHKITGKYLTAEELHQWIKTGKKFYIMDMRNNYEHKSGYFKDSILPDIDNFRDLPKVLPELKKFDDRPIVTVCTGGIRCERASGLLIKYGFKDVYQLLDGIVTYMEKYPNEDFLGKLYVFDNRLVMGFETDSPKHQIIGRCIVCNASSEHYVNCRNNICHRHYIVCDNCVESDGTILCPQGCRDTKGGER